MADLTKLNQIIEDLENESKNLKSFSELYSAIQTIKDDITLNLNLLSESNSNFESLKKNIKADTVKNYKQIKQIEITLKSKLNELYEDNKRFQKEFDSTIFTRLEKYKSDIQIEVRSIIDQIQNFKSELNEQLGLVVTNLENKIDAHRKRSRVIFLINIVLTAICLVAILMLYIK